MHWLTDKFDCYKGMTSIKRRNASNTILLGYSADGQLVTSNVASAVHGPNGLRLQKTTASCAGGVTTNFVYDELGHLIGEYDALGSPIQEIIWIGDTPVAVYETRSQQSAPVHYIYADHLNTSRAITNPNGQLVWSWDGEPFGASAPSEDPSGLGRFVFGLRFPGQYFDEETGFHSNRWREYDPKLGRYVQTDPIGLAGGINSYAYVENNPLQLVDPTGLEPPKGAMDFEDFMRNTFFPRSSAPGAGCGDAGTDDYVPDFFPKSCHAHDLCYADQAGKLHCDLKFCADMLKERPDMPLIARVYFSAVFLFGLGPYNNVGR